jgi:hypothetical protein
MHLEDVVQLLDKLPFMISKFEFLQSQVSLLCYSTINCGGMGQLSKLPRYRPVMECHRGNVILDLNSD